MLNHIVLMGRLTRDPELRYTQSQIPVASFRIAVDRDFGRGEDRQTDFIDVVAWRSTGEFVNKYFHKGSMIVVSGRLQMRDWQDKDGNRRTSAEVVADNVYFGESAKRDADGGRSDSYGDRSYGGDRGGDQSNGQGSRQPSAPAEATAITAAAATSPTARARASRALPRPARSASWTATTASCRFKSRLQAERNTFKNHFVLEVLPWRSITRIRAASARRYASSASTRSLTSTIRTLLSSGSSSPSAARSCPAALPAPAPCTSVS